MSSSSPPIVGARSRGSAAGEADRGPALPRIPAWTLVAGVLLSAVLFGRLVAGVHIKYAIAIVLVACYAPLVFFDLKKALAVWVAILFFQNLRVLSSGPNAVGVLIGLGWLGTFLGSHRATLIGREHRRLLLTIAGFCVYLTLTIAWAANSGSAGTEAAYWWMAALGFLVVLTTISSPHDVGLVALAFVIGSVISVMIGLATGSLGASASISQTAIQGRLVGGGGDPNQQAAAFVAATFMLVGLFSIYRRRSERVWLLIAFVIVTVGFFGTQSRGGLVAFAFATVATLVLAPRQRRQILALLLLVAVAAVIVLAVIPGALARITDLGGGSSGRSDLWRVAWEVFTGHPLFGIGAGNFQVVESHYALRPGTITHIQYLTSVPQLVNNTYLQLLAETGIVGLLGYLAVIFGSLRAAAAAARRFEALGRHEYADLTRAIMMGTIGMLAALFFISDGDDLRLWVLLALGPALLGMAVRASSGAGAAGGRATGGSAAGGSAAGGSATGGHGARAGPSQS